MTAGILTILGAGLLIGLLLSSKKGQQAGRNLLRKGKRFQGRSEG